MADSDDEALNLVAGPQWKHIRTIERRRPRDAAQPPRQSSKLETFSQRQHASRVCNGLKSLVPHRIPSIDRAISQHSAGDEQARTAVDYGGLRFNVHGMLRSVWGDNLLDDVSVAHSKMQSRGSNTSERSLISMQSIMTSVGHSGQAAFVSKIVDAVGGEDFVTVKQVWDEATHRIAVDREIMAESLGCDPLELVAFKRRFFDRLKAKPCPSYSVQTFQAEMNIRWGLAKHQSETLVPTMKILLRSDSPGINQGLDCSLPCLENSVLAVIASRAKCVFCWRCGQIRWLRINL